MNKLIKRNTLLLIICFVIILRRRIIINARNVSLKANDGLTEGSECVMEDGSTGRCVELQKCPMRIMEVRESKRFSTSAGRCTFKNLIEIVCCPENFLRPADKACDKFENSAGINDEVKPNIFGGTNTVLGEFPYIVALGYITDKENPSFIKYNCGGTLISAQYILSAAHCVNNINNFVPVEVKVGTVDLNDNAKYVQRIPIDHVISHPKYKRSMNYYDIAILKLKRPIIFSRNIKPICLQTKPIPNLQQLVNMSLIVIGWGATSFEEEGSSILKKTPNLQVIDKKKCSEAYIGFSKLPKGLDESMICVLDANITRRADACHGDSGGPLLLHFQTTNIILGVTSFGQSCGSSIPAVYTSVISYLDWIEKTIWMN